MRLLIITFILALSHYAGCSQTPIDTIQNNRPYALIAGGSKGIGYAVAEALAKRKFNLVLVARHMETLQHAKQALESKHDITVHVLSYDLSKTETANEIAAWCRGHNIALKVLCNVAGLGGSLDYLSLPLDSIRYMVNLNLESCLAMSQVLLPLLEENSPSYILNVSSMAGYAPIPSKNMYSATKAAVIFFSYSLRNQLRKRKISVSCLTPGPVYTKPSIKQETERQLGWFGRQLAVSPERVGEITVRKMMKRKTLIVPGTLAKTTSILLRILPRRWAAGIYHKIGSDK